MSGVHVDSPGVLQRRVNRAMRAAGVDGTFHQLRHRYGTLAYQETRDLVAVGEQMGHMGPQTTAIYAAANDDTADVIAEAVTAEAFTRPRLTDIGHGTARNR